MMKIQVTAKTRQRLEKVEEIAENSFVISVKEPPSDGRANIAIAKALAKHLDIPISRIRLVAGISSKNKVFGIQ